MLLVLNPPAHALLRLGHRRNRCELLHHRVVPEGALDREGGVACLDTAVLALQQFDLLVQQILRQLIRILNPGPLEHFAVTPDRALLVQRRRGHGRLVVATAELVVTVGLVMVVVRQLLRRHIVLLLLGRRRLGQVHVTSACGTVVRGRAEATAGITAGAGTTGRQDTTTTTGMMMVCRVNLGWTIDLLWKTQHRCMMLRVRFRLALPPGIAHHRNVARLRSHHRRLLLTAPTSVTSSTTSSSVAFYPVITTSVAHTHTDTTTPLCTTTMAVTVTVPVTVVVAVISSRAPFIRFRFEIQTVQLFAEVVVAAVLVRIVPEVPFAGRSGTASTTAGTERILVTELFAIVAVRVKVLRPRRRTRRGLPVTGRGTTCRGVPMVVVSSTDSDSGRSVVMPVVVVVLEVVMVHSASTVQFRIEHCFGFGFKMASPALTCCCCCCCFPLLLFSKSPLVARLLFN